jgi:hypothetical protein
MRDRPPRDRSTFAALSRSMRSSVQPTPLIVYYTHVPLFVSSSRGHFFRAENRPPYRAFGTKGDRTLGFRSPVPFLARFKKGHFRVARRLVVGQFLARCRRVARARRRWPTGRLVVGQFLARCRRVARARRRWRTGNELPYDEPCACHPGLNQAPFFSERS